MYTTKIIANISDQSTSASYLFGEMDIIRELIGLLDLDGV